MRQVTFVLSILLLGTASAKSLGQAYYTHTSPRDNPINNDGFEWPDSPNGQPGGAGLFHLESFETPDFYVNYYNATGNQNFFDDNYQAAGNSAYISGEAWWGNPKPHNDCCGTMVELDFYNAADMVSQVSFNISLALASGIAPDFIDIEAYNLDGDSAFFTFPLEPYDPGAVFQHHVAYAGNVTIYADDLPPFFYDEEQQEEMFAIGSLGIDLSGIEHPGGVGEFAIDNVSIDSEFVGSGTEGLYPISGGERPELITGWRTRFLKGERVYNVGQSIYNNNPFGSTYSIQMTGDFADPGGLSNRTLGPREIERVDLGTLDLNVIESGSYDAELTIVNHSDPNDDVDNLTIQVEVYDVPVLTDNSGGTFTGGSMSIANAANLAHDGALRAGVEITGIDTDIPGFTMDGFDVGDFVSAGTTLSAQPSSDLSGSFAGTYTVHLQMNSEAASYLNDRKPVDSITWNVAYTAGQNDPFDLDGDGAAGVSDLDQVVLAIASGDLAYDLDGSGSVDQDDIAAWLAGAGAARFGPGKSYSVGDMDLNGVVDSGDLNVVGLNWRSDVQGWSQGDTNGDGTVDAIDLNAVGLNWQKSAASPAAVPEPSNWVLLSSVLLIGLCRRRGIRFQLVA